MHLSFIATFPSLSYHRNFAPAMQNLTIFEKKRSKGANRMPPETFIFIGICLLTGLCIFLVARPAKPMQHLRGGQGDAITPQLLTAGCCNLSCGQEQQVEVDQAVCTYQAQVRLLCASRGEEAYNTLYQVNTHNGRPAAGMEYLIALLEISVLQIQPETSTASVSPFDVECLQPGGEPYARKSMVLPQPALRGELQSGTSLTGWVAFEIRQQDSCPQLVFGRDFAGKGGARFSLLPKEEVSPSFNHDGS